MSLPDEFTRDVEWRERLAPPLEVSVAAISWKPQALLIMKKNGRGAPKSAYELAMERLRAADEAAGATQASLDADQKTAIAEARQRATARLAEREILFKDTMRKTEGPEEREKTEREYQIDRQRINDDCEREIEGIRNRKADRRK
jgi:hypothetical protein